MSTAQRKLAGVSDRLHTDIEQTLMEAHARLQGRQVGVDWSTLRLGIGTLGIGMFARRLIHRQERIAMFSGDLLDFADTLTKGEFECWPLQVAQNTYVDLHEPGCYFNHSCSPNAGVVGRTLIAFVEIQLDQEIRYDYSTTMDEDSFEMDCRCGSQECRGRVRDFRQLPYAVQQRYLAAGIVQPFIACRYTQATLKRQIGLVDHGEEHG